MVIHKAMKDKHFPLLAFNNPIRRLFISPGKYCVYVKGDQTVADLGCGPGYYTFALADSVGPNGKVYAVDLDEKVIRSVQRKVKRGRYSNIETHTVSAANLSFIKDESVDFVLAVGLLCSIAPADHQSAVSEIKRILKFDARAFLKVARGSMSYVEKSEWEAILNGFRVERRNYDSFLRDRWALVSKM
jgi:ubiquinone/menaquinone biosynthesis C-methylase UbiE